MIDRALASVFKVVTEEAAANPAFGKKLEDTLAKFGQELAEKRMAERSIENFHPLVEYRKDAAGFERALAEGDHDDDGVETHVAAQALDGAAFQRKSCLVARRGVAGSAANADHRVFFLQRESRPAKKIGMVLQPVGMLKRHGMDPERVHHQERHPREADAVAGQLPPAEGGGGGGEVNHPPGLRRGPFHVHGQAVVVFEGDGHAGQVEDFGLAQHESRALGLGGGDSLCGIALGLGGDHLDLFRAKRLLDDGGLGLLAREGFEGRVFVGIDRTLDDGVAQSPGGGDGTIWSKPFSVSMENSTPEPPLSDRTKPWTPIEKATVEWSKPFCVGRVIDGGRRADGEGKVGGLGPLRKRAVRFADIGLDVLGPVPR